MKCFINLYPSINILSVIKIKGYVRRDITFKKQMRSAYNFLVRKDCRKRLFGRLRSEWVNNIKTDVGKSCERVTCSLRGQDMVQWRVPSKTALNFTTF
jgi:hypothetical protein